MVQVLRIVSCRRSPECPVACLELGLACWWEQASAVVTVKTWFTFSEFKVNTMSARRKINPCMNCLQLSLAAWTHALATGIKNIIFVLSSCYPAHYHPQGVIVCNKTGRIIVIIPLSHYPISEIYYAELWFEGPLA